MVVNFKELVEGIKDYVETEITDIKFCEYNDDINREGKEFPALFYYWDQPGAIRDNVNQANVTFVFCDIGATDGHTNKPDHEIHNECVTFASQLFDWLQRNNYLNGDIDFQAQAFGNRANDGLAGLQITVPFIMTKPGYDV